MNPHKLPASEGIFWLKQSFKIVSTAPVTVFAIMGAYALAFMVAGLPDLLNIPFLGAVLASLVTPFGCLAFAECGRKLTQGQRSNSIECIRAGTDDRTTRTRLALSGLIYGVCVIVIGQITQLLSAPYVSKWKIIDGKPDITSVMDNLPLAAYALGLVLYVFLLSATCFAPMLIAWKKQSVGKAFFFSIVVFWRNAAPVALLTLLIFLIATGASGLLSSLGSAGIIILIPLLFAISAVTYCTLYPMWRSIFEPDVSPLN